MALTDTAIKALKPKDKPYIVTDENGLYLEIFPTGGKVWRFRYQLNGKTEKLTLGKYPALSLKSARGRRDDAAKKAAEGQSPARQKQMAKVAGAESTTLKEFAERFFQEIQARDRKDASAPRRYLDKDILPVLGEKRMCDITTEDVRTVVWRKKEHGFDAAAGELRNFLKRMFDFATTCGLVTTNPAASIKMRHVYRAKSRERALSPDEIRTFLKTTFESNIRRQFKVAFHIILLTLVRKSELIFARWENVDFENAEWHIPAEQSKTGKPHIVYLSRQAVERFRELEKLASGSELVMPGRSSLSKPFARNALNNALHEVIQETEIPAFTIHDLRRTASTLLHENGWPSDVVEKALNHTIGGVRGIYNRAEYAEQRREMLQAWADYIGSLISDGQVILGRFRRVS